MKIRAFQDPENADIMQWWFICPGCGTAHAIDGPADAFNGDLDNPTIDVGTGTIYRKGTDRQCWVDWIEDGLVHYHTRSHHEHAGKSAPLPEIEEPDG